MKHVFIYLFFLRLFGNYYLLLKDFFLWCIATEDKREDVISSQKRNNLTQSSLFNQIYLMAPIA